MPVERTLISLCKQVHDVIALGENRKDFDAKTKDALIGLEEALNKLLPRKRRHARFRTIKHKYNQIAYLKTKLRRLEKELEIHRAAKSDGGTVVVRQRMMGGAQLPFGAWR